MSGLMEDSWVLTEASATNPLPFLTWVKPHEKMQRHTDTAGRHTSGPALFPGPMLLPVDGTPEPDTQLLLRGRLQWPSAAALPGPLAGSWTGSGRPGGRRPL